MNILYISATYGASGNTGTSWETAIDTITEALLIAVSGDKLIIDPSNYEESLLIQHSITLQAESRTGESGNVIVTGEITATANYILAIDAINENYWEFHNNSIVTITTGLEVYPVAVDVRYGVEYGPVGDDYTGTLEVLTTTTIDNGNDAIYLQLYGETISYRPNGTGTVRTLLAVVNRSPAPVAMGPGRGPEITVGVLNNASSGIDENELTIGRDTISTTEAGVIRARIIRSIRRVDAGWLEMAVQ